MTASEIEALGGYYGATPKPADFEAFWQARMAEADAVPLDYTVTQAKEVPSWDGCDFLDLWFTGMAGARIYAKYLRPHSDKPVPLVLQFHGYPGASRSFAEQASFAGMGMALIAMDCPGQAGYSVDAGGFLGTTVSGHIVAGLDGPAEGMYYVRLHQDIRILCRIVRQLQEIDLRRVFVNGGSQGGGLGLACCALNPGLINRAAILYPFLSDFKLVWDLGADEIAYEGIRYYVTPTSTSRTAGSASWAISTAKTLPPWCSARCCLARAWRMSSARPRPSAPSTTICTAKKSGIFSPVMGTRRLQNLTICC